MPNGFRYEVDTNKLAEICLAAYDAYERSVGIFKNGREKFLPQFNLPEEVESCLQSNPVQAANYLFLSASMEKRIQTQTNIKNGLRVWAQRDKKWIFNPVEVSRRNFSEMEQICVQDFRYVVNGFAKSYYHNSIKMAEVYGGDPRRIIQNQTAEEARKRLTLFSGIGNPIANLITLYYMERGIVSPTDPKNALLKVDVHKARIPLNMGCVNIGDEEQIRVDLLVPLLEKSYWEICKKNNLNPVVLDTLLWIIGSEICSMKNYFACDENCPIENSCISNVPYSQETGKFVVFKNGKRVETRRNIRLKDQLLMSFQ